MKDRVAKPVVRRLESCEPSDITFLMEGLEKKATKGGSAVTQMGLKSKVTQSQEVI